MVISLGVTIGCASKSAATTLTQVTATIRKGNLINDITAVGNLSYSTSEDLSFDTSGYVSDILVEVGDSVAENQVVAKLNMTEWEQNITNLQSTVANKQMALTQAEQSLTTAQRNVIAKERAITTAETNLATAQYNLTVKTAGGRPGRTEYRNCRTCGKTGTICFRYQYRRYMGLG